MQQHHRMARNMTLSFVSNKIDSLIRHSKSTDMTIIHQFNKTKVNIFQ